MQPALADSATRRHTLDGEGSATNFFRAILFNLLGLAEVAVMAYGISVLLTAPASQDGFGISSSQPAVLLSLAM
jgi:hypothetical protein